MEDSTIHVVPAGDDSEHSTDSVEGCWCKPVKQHLCPEDHEWEFSTKKPSQRE